jgi:hypothetical protein
VPNWFKISLVRVHFLVVFETGMFFDKFISPDSMS